VLAVIFVAALIQSAFGFGSALIAVPLLALRIPLETVTPLVVLASITMSTIVVIQDWKKIHFRSAGWLVFSTFFGIPLGLLLLTSNHQKEVKAVLGVLIIGFSLYALFGPAPLELKRDSTAWLLACGFFAGILGGAFGINGPPLAIYGAMRRWSAQHFRATLQGYFLPASILGMASFWLDGLWTRAVTHYYLIALPALLLGVFLGREINHRLRGDVFLKYIYAGMICIGALLLVQVTRAKL